MLTDTDLVNWLGLKNPNSVTVTQVVLAVNIYVNSLPGIDRLDNTGNTWAGSTHFGALLLAARWYQRKTSANGVSANTDSGAIYVTKYDSDIARLLHIDGFQKPMVG